MNDLFSWDSTKYLSLKPHCPTLIQPEMLPAGIGHLQNIGQVLAPEQQHDAARCFCCHN